jgi:hypothetical protein
MSRIYQGGSADSRYRQTDLGQAYAPGKAASGERQAKEWKQQVIQDGQTKARDLERKAQSETLQSKLEMNVEASGLKQQQLANEIELKMDQTYETNTLKQEQLYEKLSMDMEAKELSAQASVQNANMSAMKGAVQGILSFAGSAMKFAEVQGQINEREEKKQAIIDGGSWAFTSDFDSSSPAGQSVVQAEQQQGTVEVVEEVAISRAAPGDPATQEALRQSVGIGQTEARLQNQISVGEASASINGRLRDAFYDPNRTVTVLDASGQAIQIRPMDAKSGQLNQVLRSLGQQLTQEMGLAGADRYTAVTQYVPKLEAAINAVSSSEYAGRLAGEQSNREQLGFTRASQALANGDVAGSWSQYYQAAAISGLYDGDQGKITKAAVEAMVQDATPAQLEQLKNGSIRVFEGGPTFANDKRFAGLIDEAIRDKNKGIITDHSQNIKFQEIELSNATNAHVAALMEAGDNPQATQQAHEAYEASLGALSRAGNAKARSELVKQQSIGNNYNPENFQALRNRIANGETFTEDFLKQQLATFRIKPSEYAALKQAGLATPDRVENTYGGKQAYNAQNASVKATVNQTLGENNTFFGQLPNDIQRSITDNIGVDIIKRRDDAVSRFIAENGGEVAPGDIQAFSQQWTSQNVPALLKGVVVDKDNGLVTGYTYMGATSSFKKPTPTFSSAYVRNPDGTVYEGRNLQNRSPLELGTLKNKGLNYAGDSILTRQERLDGAKAYIAGETIPPGITAKANALGVTPDYLVREQLKGVGKELGEYPTKPIPSGSEFEKMSYSPNEYITQTERRALDVIAKYESSTSGQYNAVNQYGGKGGHSTGNHLGMYSGDIRSMSQHGGRAVTDMTVGEIIELQSDNGSLSNSQWRDAGKLHAVGRYQFTRDTFKEVASRLGLGNNLKLTPDVQDAMALSLLRSAGLSRWVGPTRFASPSEKAQVNAARIMKNPNATTAQLRRAALSSGISI